MLILVQRYRVTGRILGETIASELFRDRSATANFYFLRYTCARRNLRRTSWCVMTVFLCSLRGRTLRVWGATRYAFIAKPCPSPGGTQGWGQGGGTRRLHRFGCGPLSLVARSTLSAIPYREFKSIDQRRSIIVTSGTAQTPLRIPKDPQRRMNHWILWMRSACH